MASRGRGLGRGLAGLLASEQTDGHAANAFRIVPLRSIKPNPRQPRKRFPQEHLATLAESIGSVGILQPLLVRPQGREYELIAGERRFRAAQIAGLTELPVFVRPGGERESLELALVENVARQDLNPIEEAHAIASLLEDFELSQTELAARLGRSRSALANLLRLLELPDAVMQQLEQGNLSEGHGRALLALRSQPLARKVASQIVKEGMSVRQTERLVASLIRVTPNSPRPNQASYVQEVLDAAYRFFELPVRFSAFKGRRKGTLTIEVSNDKELFKLQSKLADTASIHVKGEPD